MMQCFVDDLNAPDLDGRLPIEKAIEAGDADLLRELIIAGAYFYATLSDAIDSDQPDVVRMLTEAVDDGDKRGEHWLFVLAIRRGSTDMVSAFLEVGEFHVNARDSDGKSMLDWAVSTGDLKYAMTLIHAGAEVNARDDRGLSTLYWALHTENADIVRALIDAGADVHEVLPDGESLVALAKRIAAERGANYDHLQLLIDSGAKAE